MRTRWNFGCAANFGPGLSVIKTQKFHPIESNYHNYCSWKKSWTNWYGKYSISHAVSNCLVHSRWCRISAIDSIIDYEHMWLISRNKWYLVKNIHSWIPSVDSWMFIPGHSTKGTIMVHITVSNGGYADSQASELSFLCPFYMNPDGDGELPFCIEHWNCTCWRRWIGALHPFLRWPPKGRSSWRLISGLWAALRNQITQTWQLFGDSLWHGPDSWCRYWCSWLNNKTEPFDSQHVRINHSVSKWLVRSIHSRDVGINPNSLLYKFVILEYWDGIFPSPRFLLTMFKSHYQISIWPWPSWLSWKQNKKPNYAHLLLHISQELHAVTLVKKTLLEVPLVSILSGTSEKKIWKTESKENPLRQKSAPRRHPW